MAWDAGAAVLGDVVGGGAAASGGFSLASLAPWAGPAASIGGALIGADATRGAANTQAGAANTAAGVSQNMFNTTQANLAPFMNTGNMALGDLGFLTGTTGADKLSQQWFDPRFTGGVDMAGAAIKPFSATDLANDPIYKNSLDFATQQGEDAINKRAAASGNFYAPKTLQDIGKFDIGTANMFGGDAYNRFNTNVNNIWQRLSQLAGQGQNAAANTGSLGVQTAGQIGNNLTSAGAATAAGQVGGANAITGGINNAYNSYLMQQILGQSQAPVYS